MKKNVSESHPVFADCKNGNVALVKASLEKDVDPHSRGLVATAVASGSVEMMNVFLDAGYAVDSAFNDFGETILLRVIESKNRKLLDFLIQKGANVNAKDLFGGTPLIRAAGSWPEAVRVLLDAGACLSAAGSKGGTPIIWAARGNQVESLQLLHLAGANLEDKDDRGSTPLIVASKTGGFEAVQWLLKNKVNQAAVDNFGYTALMWAKENKHLNIVGLLE